MANYAYIAGYLLYVARNGKALLVQSENTLIIVRCEEGSYKHISNVIVEGSLNKDLSISAEAIEEREDVEPVNLLIFDGKIGYNSKYPMIVKCGKNPIHPNLIDNRPPRKAKLDKRKKRRIVAKFVEGPKIRMLKATEM